jgi:hypothetical protein
MYRKSLLISSFFLTAALLAPAAITANAAPQSLSIRVYDRDHKDYHNWDDRESRSYDQYRVEHPRYNAEFSREGRRHQRNYWNWRHEHPDHD